MMKEFTLEKYAEKHLPALTAEYKPVSFPHLRHTENDAKCMVVRHDVDISLKRAVAMAEVELDQKVRATYFINLSSQYYNPFSPYCVGMISDIVSMGHHIGLHYHNFKNISNPEYLSRALYLEKRKIERLLPVEIGVFSFHNPTPVEHSFKDSMYGMMVNASSLYFYGKVSFMGDSDGQWKKISCGTENKLQFLTHPVWWTPEKDGLLTRETKAASAIHDQSIDIINRYKNTWKRD